ncbi:MAG: biopolymer transporter ExbD [Pseudomonadota bacterium]
MEYERNLEFGRTSRRVLNLPLIPLIDVVFILIIFFMLTTSFMRIESLELMLPSVGKAASKKEVTHIFVKENGEIILGKRNVEPDELSEALLRIFAGDPTASIMLLSAEGVTMQQLVAVMDRVSAAGGKSLFVRKWVQDEDKQSDAPDGDAQQ